MIAPAATVRQFTIGVDDDGVRLDRWFKRHLPQVGFATVSRWARTGQIRIDGKRADPADRLATGQVLRVPPGGTLPARTAAVRARRELSEDEIARAEGMVIHQDRAAIVLNKLPGLPTQGGSGVTDHVDGLLDAFVAPDDLKSPRPRLVHRLDKDTSGVLLIARTPGSAAYFSKRFSGRSARKIYWALVVGVPDRNEGEIDLPLAKQPGTGGEKMMVDKSEQGQVARTRYRVLDRAGNSAAWVELHPLTGRTHQLRVHMAAIGHPIVGDGKYAGQDAFLTGSISRKMHLHARRLIIDHPDGTPLDVTAALPDHFAASMEQMGFTESEGDAKLETLLEDFAIAGAEPRREEKKAAAKAHAKQYRKERRGERRKRGEGPATEAPARSAARPSTRSGARPAPREGARPDARPEARPDTRSGTRGAARSETRPDVRPSSRPARPSSRPASAGPRGGGRPGAGPAPRKPRGR